MLTIIVINESKKHKIKKINSIILWSPLAYLWDKKKYLIDPKAAIIQFTSF